MMRTIHITMAVAVLLGGMLTTAMPANAVTLSAHKYSNCTDIHRVYSGGIAKAGVKYNKVSGRNKALKGNVKHSTALYNANKKMDRDHDGISCEKS
jgi:cytochrome c2